MINHVGFEPPELCECGERYQRRDGLCWSCWTAAQDRRAEEQRDREVTKRQERREANE